MGGEGAAELVGVNGDTGSSSDTFHDPGEGVPVEAAAMIGDEAFVGADVFDVVGGPAGEQNDQVGVQGDVAVVAEFADREAQPVAGTDEHDGVSGEVADFSGAHPGAGQQLDDESVAWIGGGAGGDHQFGCVAVVEELGERVGSWWEIAADDRVAAWGVVPFPLDDPFEEHAQRPEALALGVERQGGAGLVAGLGGEPDFERLVVVAADLGDRDDGGVGVQEPGELAQRVVGDIDRQRRQERCGLGQVTGHRGGHLRAVSCDLGPYDLSLAAGRLTLRAGLGDGHQPITSCSARSSATATWSASISAAAR